MKNVRKIEILAPARDLATARAAIRYGADAVYIGAPMFGARHAAGNSVEDIATLVREAHLWGVRVYVTMNTILYDSELERARELALQLVSVGVDALIIQDAAYLRMGIKGVEFHASTQMAIRTPEEARFWAACGCTRVVLERGMTFDEIRAVCETGVEVECFVHGAICVGYSGRCFLSRSMSPRSGNRGECSQPCRLTWDLVDERGRTIVANKHLLSVRDLNLSRHIEKMARAGVVSFKIEGRLKDENYIKNTVAYYRQIVDASPNLCAASQGECVADFKADPRKTFLRGDTDYFFRGVQRGVASFDTPKSIGEQVGVVGQIGRTWFELAESNADLHAGDGLCWLSNDGFVGTNVNKVEGRRIYPNKLDKLTPRAVVYRNLDAEFVRALGRSTSRRTMKIDASVTFSEDAVRLKYTTADGVSAESGVEESFELPRNVERMEAMVREQVCKSGDTAFVVQNVELQGDVRFVPSSVLAQLRRDALAELEQKLSERKPESRFATENIEVKFPTTKIDGSRNVTNAVSRQFYLEHGAEVVEQGWDLAEELYDKPVMTTRYCLRRELGMCLLEKPKYRGALYLERGAWRYRLEFDCRKCEMRLIAEDICKD
ncbi:MAG: U32 family peptidase [Rikenellaceae bacterium]|nr:U32 family peptidase [Rikenellaceae bacterium]